MSSLSFPSSSSFHEFERSRLAVKTNHEKIISSVNSINTTLDRIFQSRIYIVFNFLGIYSKTITSLEEQKYSSLKNVDILRGSPEYLTTISSLMEKQISYIQKKTHLTNLDETPLNMKQKS